MPRPPRKLKKKYTLQARERSLYTSMRVLRKGSALPFTVQEFIRKVDEAIFTGLCPYCLLELTVDNISPDHIVPLCKGGSWDLDNIEIVCFDCNTRKGFMDLEDFLATKPWKLARLESHIPKEKVTYWEFLRKLRHSRK